MDLKTAQETCKPNIQMAIRQVTGGFIVTGIIHWTKDGEVVMSQQDEAISSDPTDCGAYVVDYIEKFAFNPVYQTIGDQLRDALLSRAEDNVAKHDPECPVEAQIQGKPLPDPVGDPPGTRATATEDIPAAMYWNASSGNFHSQHDGRSAGDGFFNYWIDRKSDFPTKPYAFGNPMAKQY